MNNRIDSPPTERTARPLVLMLDDEPAVLAALRSLFHRLPYDIHMFSDGAQALEFLMQQTPDIIISDMRMPVMNGTAFLSRAAQICPTSTRLILSGYEDRSIILQAIANGTAQMYILKPWEDKEMLAIIDDALRTRAELRTIHLDEFLRSITTLPSPAGIQSRIKEVLSKKPQSIKVITTEVEKDPALVAHLMRIANSVYYGARNPITEIQEAITFIGIEYVKSLALASDVLHTIGKGVDTRFTRHLEDLWHHALQRALIGRAIAEQWSGFQQPQVAYIACLLFDIGFVVRLSTDPEKYNLLVDIAKQMNCSVMQAESKVFDIDHAEVGGTLLHLWNFPNDIVNAVRNHHDPSENDVLNQIVQIADILESGDRTQPYDTKLNETIQEWQTKLFSFISNKPSST